MPLGRVERLQIMLTPDELTAVDDWRFARQMPSRAAGIRELLRRGLAAEGLPLADRSTKSKDFGVFAPTQKSKPVNGRSPAKS
jgi:hypothetical protein